MKIIGLETVQVEEFSNIVWVRLHTDEGLVGLGETFRNPLAVIAYLHETCAPYLLGKNPIDRTAISRALRDEVGNNFKGFPTRSVEIRGNSAVDIALWDLCGKAAGQPIHTLLGGRSREKIRMYNTCANSEYNNKVRAGYNQQIFSRDEPPPARIGRHEDLLLQVYEPARLAQELLDEGISAMKIWPFDVFARRNGGMHITPQQIREGLWPIEQIRNAVGDRMEIMIEYHGLWKAPPAIEIANALSDYGITWHEDPIALDNFSDLAEFRRQSGARVAASENLGTTQWFREAFTRGIVDVATFDVTWTGGLSEAQRVTHLADTFDRPIAPHDCTGPVTLLANLHLLAHAPNGLIAETVRSHLDGFYRTAMTDIPKVENGYIAPLAGPGLGAEFDPEFLKRSDILRRVSGVCATQ
ncbi:hypothetical protein GTW25_00840 [Aliihoeflea aestuarii]|jgi:galactonate dehydratase|uniref:mandelate racemase/muconate lactonizing enzyme family protein n=1 Tax=Aliihoeflea aestuarii TaxID=453840 RepID=UPI002092BE5B|nr:mandelate racemase/muconate lactonizing enzyme family protein [Aliihoeflea aestuarii]MCO6389576.1 hypothetical protein [Aliihoeflea aestuarii]